MPVFKGNPLGPGHGRVWKELGLLKAVFTSRCLLLQQLNLRGKKKGEGKKGREGKKWKKKK